LQTLPSLPNLQETLSFSQARVGPQTHCDPILAGSEELDDFEYADYDAEPTDSFCKIPLGRESQPWYAQPKRQQMCSFRKPQFILVDMNRPGRPSAGGSGSEGKSDGRGVGQPRSAWNVPFYTGGQLLTQSAEPN
jgi:hypothetical protein